MKLIKMFFASLVITVSLFYAATCIFAYPQSLCNDKILDTGEANGTFVKTEAIENRLFAVIKIGEEDWHLAINYDDRDKYYSLEGKPVTIKYQLEQYYDEHDMECVRQEQLVAMSAAGGNAQAAGKAIQIQPGYFKASTRDAEPVNIFLDKDGTGYSIGMGYHALSWNQNGASLNLNSEIFEGMKAKVISPTSFELDDFTYTIDPNYKAAVYNYAEKGFNGQMVVVWDSSPEIPHVSFETFENTSASTCEGQLVCESIDGKLSCHKYGTDEAGDITLKFSGNNLSVASSYPESDFCGKQGSFTGLYKK